MPDRVSDRIVVVEDDRELREFLTEVLQEAGHEVVPYPTADAALAALQGGAPADLVLSDLIMPGRTGEELLTALRASRPELHVIIMTAFGSIDSAIELVKAGAYDYLTKPLGTNDLLLSVERALQDSRPRREHARAARSATVPPPPGFVGASRPMQAVYELIRRAGRATHPVLVTGESGTGKELVARALHDVSGRGAFVTVNCGALPETLLESELFGHERGAFTGADRAKQGLFEVAHGGTLFLDEIGELPLTLQPKLLRALEQAEIRRLGATQPQAVDVRVLAATNRDLEQEVEQGRFRDDLFWRLNVLQLHVPPLRERVPDIPPLAEHFLARATDGVVGPRRISRETMSLLTAYPWPGNVRELRNAIQRAATLASGDEVTPDDLPPRIRQAGQVASLIAAASRRQVTLHEVERLYILEVLRHTGGNRSRAAEILDLDRKTLYRKLEEYRAEHPELEL
ncbi:MAG TPA: sigma-54 dependent transcriptional regulator [Gemmatimonadales bacterium]|nr:sigma-54 dependent transcriptional regulator [Gemmatimonadales bacterium]